MAARDHSLGRSLGAFVVHSLPAVFLLYFILRYGIDTPWGDQWDGMAQLFEKMQSGTLALSDFFAFHNEHRIFFPRLLSFALALLTHWNIRAEMLLIWALLCLCALSLCGIARATGSRGWLLFPANILLFTVRQWENLLWGFQIGFLLPLATLTAALWAAVSLRRPFDFLAAMALCLVTTFSIASGCTSWLLITPVLFFTKNQTRSAGDQIWWIAWALVAGLSVYFYFHGFAPPKAHPSEAHAFTHPLFALQFFLTYLGNPFAPATWLMTATLAPLVGGLLFVSLIVCVICLWCERHDRRLQTQALPWILLTGIALTNAFLTTVGRAGFGISAAFPPRYVSFAIMLPIGLLFLVSLLVRHYGAGKLRGIVVALAVSLTLLFVASSRDSFESLPGFQHKLLLGKSVVDLSNILDEPHALVRHVHWMGSTLRSRIEILDGLGYLHPRLIRSRNIAEIAQSPRGLVMGQVTNFARRENGDFAVGGWAILPQGDRIADSVLLAYEDAHGDWMIFARADVGVPLANANHSLGDHPYKNSGWVKSWRADELPAGVKRISAWAFNAERGQAFPIGALTIDSTTTAGMSVARQSL